MGDFSRAPILPLAMLDWTDPCVSPTRNGAISYRIIMNHPGLSSLKLCTPSSNSDQCLPLLGLSVYTWIFSPPSGKPIKSKFTSVAFRTTAVYFFRCHFQSHLPISLLSPCSITPSNFSQRRPTQTLIYTVSLKHCLPEMAVPPLKIIGLYFMNYWLSTGF